MCLAEIVKKREQDGERERQTEFSGEREGWYRFVP